MSIFRRILLPLAFLAVLIVIAALLAWIAFKPAPEDGFDAASATGEPMSSSVTAERGDLANTLELRGKIAVDKPTAVKADHDGVVNHFFVDPGDEVLEGADLFQVRTDSDSAEATAPGSSESTTADAGTKDAEAAVPEPPAKPRYYTVVAPADGTVGDFAVKKDDSVSADTEVTQLLQDSFTARASIDAVDLYRIPDLPKTASITITDGPEPFDCESLRLDQGAGTVRKTPTGGGDDTGGEGDETVDEDPASAADGGSTGGDGPELTCTIPDDVTVFNGLDLTMTIDAGEVTDVLVVPITAVRGAVDKGTVWVVGDSGEPEEREVEIGMNDGAMVEVKSGLEEGEEIEEFVPGTEPEGEGDEFGDMSGEEMGF